MSNVSGDTGAINAFGDLSRRARRELEESGVNPDRARDELLATGSIQLPTGSILTTGLNNPAFGGGVSTNTSEVPSTATGGLSRRELRAMQERTELAASTGSTQTADATGGTGSVMPSTPTFSLPASPGVPGSVAAATPQSFTQQPVAQQPVAQEPPVQQPVAQQPAELPATPQQSVGLGFGLSPALTDTATPVEQVIPQATTPLDQMFGQQAVAPTSNDPFALSTQSTGVISTTSHALIIPSPPDPLSGPILSLDQTGEILMTGQIVLPASIGTTGADAGRLDMPDVDVVDYGSEIAPSQDLAPVRATSAVSATVTRGGAVTSPIKSRDRVPLALTITATFLAVAVVGLFVTGYLLGVF